MRAASTMGSRLRRATPKAPPLSSRAAANVRFMPRRSASTAGWFTVPVRSASRSISCSAMTSPSSPASSSPITSMDDDWPARMFHVTTRSDAGAVGAHAPPVGGTNSAGVIRSSRVLRSTTNLQCPLR